MSGIRESAYISPLESRSTPPRSLRDHTGTVAIQTGGDTDTPCPPRPPSCRCRVPLPPNPTPRAIRDCFDSAAEAAIPENGAERDRLRLHASLLGDFAPKYNHLALCRATSHDCVMERAPFRIGETVSFCTVSRYGRAPERTGTVCNVYRRLGGWWIAVRLEDGTCRRTRPASVWRHDDGQAALPGEP